MKRSICLAVVAVGVTAMTSLGQNALSDSAILDFAKAAYDKGAAERTHVVLGQHNGSSVVADHPCSDLCPEYTIRVVYYDIDLDKCDEIGGAVRSILVPQSIAQHWEKFCVPKVLAEKLKDEYVDRPTRPAPYDAKHCRACPTCASCRSEP